MKIKHVTKHSLIYAITTWCLYNMTLYQLIAFIGGRLRLDYVIFADALYYGVFGVMIVMYLISGGINSKIRLNYPLLVIIVLYAVYYLYTKINFPSNFLLTRVVESYNFTRILLFCIPAMLISSKVDSIEAFLNWNKNINTVMCIVSIYFLISALIRSGSSEQLNLTYALAICLCLCLYYRSVDINKRINTILAVVGISLLLISGSRGAFLVPLVYLAINIIERIFVDETISKRRKSILLLSTIAVIIILYVFYIPLLTLIGTLVGNQGATQKIISAFINGGMFSDEGGRSVLQRMLFESYKNMPFWGYGFAGDVLAEQGLYYAHNLELELISDFGWTLGIVLSAILWLNSIKLLFGKGKRIALLPIAVYVMIYLQFSSSYLLMANFWLFLGMLFSQSSNNKIREDKVYV